MVLVLVVLLLRFLIILSRIAVEPLDLHFNFLFNSNNSSTSSRIPLLVVTTWPQRRDLITAVVVVGRLHDVRCGSTSTDQKTTVGPDDDDDGYFFISHLRFGSFGLLSGKKKKRVVVKKKRSYGVLKEAKWLAG